MAIDVNNVRNTATKLVKKTSSFASPYVDGLKITNQKFYEQGINQTLQPRLETHRLESKDGIHAEFSSRTSKNYKFEVYKLPEETIKILKNRFGEIIRFKSTMDCHNKQAEWTYRNVKETMAEKLRAFLR